MRMGSDRQTEKNRRTNKQTNKVKHVVLFGPPAEEKETNRRTIDIYKV